MKNYKISKEDYKVSKWSGGETREVFIYPAESSLEERNFQVRISSATVEVEESEFSAFNGYDRILMVLKGIVKLEHTSPVSKRTVELSSLMQDSFSGSIKTKSYGKCTDYNVISKEGLASELRTVVNG
ncbi:MAG: HutD family protein [Tissierellia bacterium]|nr:HutD family protein [Tissierellia bacterium]